jgi:uncharacterized RDD family membrane protein YckC
LARFSGFVEKKRHEDRQGAVRRASVPLAAGAILASVAVVVCIVGAPVLGGGLLLSSSVLLLWGLHLLGRLGADPPASFGR